MAIQFARIEIVGRSTGGNACCKSAYNARAIIRDEKTNLTYNFSNRKDNVYHTVLLPEGVDQKFKDLAELMNAVEHIERKKDSQLLKDIVIALPDDKELSLEDRINITHEIIEEMEWVKNGLAVQVDIHQPHDGEKNWHAHLLVTTRRFTEDGKRLFHKKARDLNPEFRTSNGKNFIIPEEDIIHEKGKRVINEYFRKLGLDNRVDTIGVNPQEHIGPVRMRSVLNQAAERNEERRLAEIEHLNSGLKVLEKVTKHMSVFNRADLMRAVKCVPDYETREELVAEALADPSVRVLCQEDGKKTGYFTTEEIRKEEEKVLRLSSYVANNKNVFTLSTVKTFRSAEYTEGLVPAANDLPEEQQIVLENVLTSKSALHIIRGRAGVGKSHVLGRINLVARASGIEVIGLAPTHKAKENLSNVGFGRTDTIKGMLFKLHNARFSLPKNSLLVVDEAGMIGNDDFSELLRVAATRQCNVILSGDEKQLASVQRGGMFEVLADKYGSSTIFQIKRQKTEWGKAVAMAFSRGEVRRGIAILQQEDRIRCENDANSSMQALLSNWQESDYAIEDRLILAVKNKDVAALNHGVRQYLKLDGKLIGEEIEVSGNHYMKGDRILISASNKNLGLVNGDIGVILEASKERFVLSVNDNKGHEKDEDKQKHNDESQTETNKIVEFNPSEYSGFKHGYATTVFKAQGASIKDVYVFHNGFAGVRNSYVALSRNINDLKLYINTNSTSNRESLIRQLSYDPEAGSSLHFLTEDELKVHQLNKNNEQDLGLIDKLIYRTSTFVESQFTKLTDKYLPKAEYYDYREPSVASSTVEQVLDEIYERDHNTATQTEIVEEEREERLVVGGKNRNIHIRAEVNTTNMEKIMGIGDVSYNVNGSGSMRAKNLEPNRVSVSVSSTKQTAKERFYARADYARNREQKDEENVERYKEEYRTHIDKLRGELRFNAESVALDLLGKPNRKLSTRSILKYGNKGSLAVKTNGMKAGTWYDFEKGEGGDMFDLVQQEKGCDFKESVEYLSDFVGMSRAKGSNIVHLHNVSDRYVDYHKEQSRIRAEEVNKKRKADNLYARSKEIDGSSIASRYLVRTRKINLEFTGETISKDIRTASIYEKSLDKRLPALIAFARDKEGNITGGQQLLLDSKTLRKADVEIPRRSFGKIAGSFVEISSNTHLNGPHMLSELKNQQDDQITIIAEGLETALSLHHAGIEGKIICSLGISNIKNYIPKKNEKIIIAADNDGKGAITNATINEAKALLSGQLAIVQVVRPEQLGDFNDLLQSYEEGGILEIRASFNPVIANLKAKTLGEFFSNDFDDKDQYSNFGYSKRPKQITEVEFAKIQEDLTYVRKYSIPEEQLLNSFKVSYAEGMKELANTKEKVLEAEKVYDNGNSTQILEEIKVFGHTIDKPQIINELISIEGDKKESYLEEIRDKTFKSYLKTAIASFNKDKMEANNITKLFEVVSKEQEFLGNLAKNHETVVRRYNLDNPRENLHAICVLANEKTHLLQDTKEIAGIANKEGTITEFRIMDTLRNTLNIQEMYTGIDQIREKDHIEDSIELFREEKLSAKTLEGLLKVVEKEQNFLLGLDGNIKYSQDLPADYITGRDISKVVSLAKESAEDKVREKIGTVIDYCTKNNLIADWRIASFLRQTTDLKSTYEELEKVCESHHVKSNLELFEFEKGQAKSLDEVFSGIQKEQNFLNNLDKDSKHLASEENLLDLINKAHSAEQSNVLPRLQELARNVVVAGMKDEVTLLEELQKSTDLASTYTSLDKALEHHHIESNLSKFKEEKSQAHTPSEVMSVIVKEQEFLGGLHNNLKYPESHSDKSLEAIEQAYTSKDSMMTDLQQVTSHILKYQVMSEQELVKNLQGDKEAFVVSTELTKACRDHYSEIVDGNLRLMTGNKVPIKIGKHKFDCPIKYLEHEIKNPAHNYADIARFKRSIPHVQEFVRQMELTKELSKGMGGMSM